MQKFKVTDGAAADGTALDRDGFTAGTKYLAKVINDNQWNVFNVVEDAGYTLIDGDLSQLAKALKGPYNPTYTYNTSAIATQTVSDVVKASDGHYYEVLADGVKAIDPVTDTTGKWKNVPTKVAPATLADEAVSKGQLSSIVKNFLKPSSSVLFTKINPTDFTIPIGFKVSVGTALIEVTSTTTLSLNTNLDTGTKTAGTDYYVYAKTDSTFYISADKTLATDRLIGGFHYGLIPETEALTDNKTEADMVAIRGINQYSFWDLKFRPVANPEGMVFVNGRWYDIYLLNSEHITNGSSKAGAVIAGGTADTTNYRAIPKIPLEFGGDGATNYGKFTWFQACEIAKSHSKELISYSEFPTIAYGVTEGKSSSTNSYEVNVGKVEHYSNLTSKWGIEQASGVEWIWGSDLANGYGTTSFAWKNNADGRGQIYSTSNSPTAVLLGASRDDGVNAGSRASSWRIYVWGSRWDIGSRFCSNHMEVL